jgi:DNA-binding NarL/FixJ family response regulator
VSGYPQWEFPACWLQGAVQQNLYGKSFPKARSCKPSWGSFRTYADAALSSGSPHRPATAPAFRKQCEVLAVKDKEQGHAPDQLEEMMGNLRLLVADDHDVVRKGVRTLLEEQPGWEVAAEAADGREAVEKAKLVQPDVTILDLSMPELNGLEAAREILKTVPTKVLILTMYDSDPLIRQTLEAGARGYLLKSDAGRDLVSAVDALRRNKTFFTPKVAQMVLEGYLGRTTKENEDDSNRKNGLRLTARQKQILQLLAEGKSSKEVAVALNISVKTAETHRANIMRRLDCHSVTELVRYAIRNHIIEA